MAQPNTSILRVPRVHRRAEGVSCFLHLEGEANQWWQWLRRAYCEENKLVTWNDFVEELWARFGPTECEDYNEALSRVKQTGTLPDY